MDKNQLTGLLLISLLVFAYFHFFAPEPQPLEESQKENIRQEQVDSITATAEPIIEDDSIRQIQNQQKYGDFAQAAQGTEKEIVLENEDIKITFSTKGAAIKSVLLKNYLTYDKKPLYLLDENSSKMDYFINTDNTVINLSDLYFASDNSNTTVAEGDTTRIDFNIQLSGGRTIQKSYSLAGNGYQVGEEIVLNGVETSNNNINFQWVNKLKEVEEHVELSRKVTTVNYYLEEEGYDYLSETSTEREEERLTIPAKWVSFKQKFFSSAIITESEFNDLTVASEINPADSNTVKTTMMNLNIPVADKATVVKFYFGPNNYKFLKDVAPDFEKNVKLGWGPLGWINKFLIIPIFHWLENFISNYGIIILILVVIIKLLLSPLSYKSYLSMAKTKVLKPELDAIKEKHGNDMQKAQAEQMQLYQKVGINPLSGCIPMLLQMPILLAMFYFFPNSIELRQEAFLWASDLSTYDTIFNLPFTIPFYGSHVSLFCLLMTASQILYTWSNSQMTTVQGPMKTMQYIMPVAFLFFLNSFPAGLTFYYFVSNVFTFGQQAIIKNFIDEDKIKAVLEENKKRNVNKKKSKFQTRLEEAMKASKEAQKTKVGTQEKAKKK